MPRLKSPFLAAKAVRGRLVKGVNLLLSNPHLSKHTDSLYQGDRQVSERGDGTLSSSSNSVIRKASRNMVTSQDGTLNHDRTEEKLGKVLEEEIVFLASDLRKLEKLLGHQMELKFTKLSTGPSHSVYVQLLVLTAADIMLRNKPRADAVLHLKVKSFNEQSTKMDRDDETLQCLSSVEKKLCKRLQVVKTLDKEGKLVPILLTPRTSKAVRLLVENRPLANIKPKHPHIFANLIDKSLSPVEILNTVSEIAQLANPGLLQDTRLHTHVATISQIMVMQAQEVKWLSSRIANWGKLDQRFKIIQRSRAEMVKTVQLLHEMDNAQGYHSTDETLSAPAACKIPKIPIYDKYLLKVPKTLPAGLLLTDGNNSWMLGSSIGRSGFGEIYRAKLKDTWKPDDYPYLIKIEVQQSGILFRDLHQYKIASRPRTIDSWKQKHGLDHLAIPKHVAFGEFEHNKVMYHFLVFERVGYDLEHKLKTVSHQLGSSDAYNTAIQLVDAIEYLHSIGFVEADIKPTKIMETQCGAINKVVLVDFGLANAFMASGRSRERFVHMIQKLHNCAVEYMSRDAHSGDAPTKRSDIETLTYNLIHWLSGKLPWKGVKDRDEVSRLKTKNMEKMGSFLAHCFGEKKFAPQLLQLLEYVRDLEYEETPSYSCVRQLLKDAMRYHNDFKLRKRASKQRCKARMAEQLKGTIPAPTGMASLPRTSKIPVLPPVRLSEQTEATNLSECPRLSNENVSHLKRKSDSDINTYSLKRVRIILNSKEILSPSLGTGESVTGQDMPLHQLQNKDMAEQQPGESNLRADEGTDFHPAASQEVEPSVMQEGDDVDQSSGDSNLTADEGTDFHPAASQEVEPSDVMQEGDDVDQSSGVTIQVKIEPEDPEYDETDMKNVREGVLETWMVRFEDAMSCFDVKPEPESEEDQGSSGQDIDQSEGNQQENISSETNAMSGDDVKPEPYCEKREDVSEQEVDQSEGIQQGNLSPETGGEV